MIDPTNNNLVPLKAAARKVPGRQNRSVHVSAIIRWIKQGLRGTQLQAVRVGGTWMTSEAWLWEFFQSLSTGKARATEQKPNTRAEAAGRKLDALLEKKPIDKCDR